MRKETLQQLKKHINDLKTISFEKVDKKASFINADTYNCTLNNGKVIKREKLKKGCLDGDAVVILPLLDNNQVILTVEPRVFTKKTVGVGLPAGYVEKGEEYKDAAIRELREETGLLPQKMIYLGGFYQDSGCSSAYNESFLALNCTKKYEQCLDASEFIKYISCSYDEALELMDLGYIEDSNAIITLEKAKQYIKK